VILLNPAIRFVPASGGRWLAVNAASGGAYDINDKTRLMAEALQQHASMPEAHVAFELAAQERISFEIFERNAKAVRVRLHAPNVTARDQLTVGFTLLPARYFATIARPFQVLIQTPLLIATGLLVPIVLWLCLQQQSLTTSLSVYRHGLVGLLVVMASVVFHEIGHAASLVRHGRSVGHLGAGINLIFPALFTEILEHAVMSRQEKFWLNIAGVYFQALFGHLVVVYSYVSGYASLRPYAVIVYLLALFQVLPLNRQDGVWLVSDLMARNSQTFRAWVQGISMLLAAGLVAFMVTRVAIPYWQNRHAMMEFGLNFFSGNAARHVSGLLGTFIVIAWALRLARSTLAVSGRRRAARIPPRQST
jgi:hypothetical protein